VPPALVARRPWPRVEAKSGPRGANLPWRLGLAATTLTTAALALAFCPVPATVALGLPVRGTGRRCSRSNRGADLGRGGGAVTPARAGTAGGDEGSAGSDLVGVGEAQLLESEHVARHGEGGDGCVVGDDVGRVEETRVEAAKEVEDELGVIHGVADITLGVDSGLHALAVGGDAGVTLLHGVELVIKEDGMGLLVGTEDVHDGNPKSTGRLGVIIHGEVKDGVIDGAKDPGLDVAVCLVPIPVGGIGGERAINVRLEAEFAAQRLEVGHPLAVVGVLHLQRDGNMGLDEDGGVGVDHDQNCQ
jgi:hypothetical protein